MSSNIAILIVEDDYSIRTSTCNKLKSLGYFKLYEASNSAEAKEIIDQNNINIALLDIGLIDSDLDGIDLAKEISKGRNIAIIFTTAFSDKATLERSQEVAHDNYLTKPINERQLHVAIQKALMSAPKKIRAAVAQESTCPLFSKNDCIYVKGKNAFYHQIWLRDVIYFQAESGGTNIVTLEHKHFTYTALTAILEASQYPDFVRIHRSIVVNKRHVVSKSDLLVEMTNKDRLKVSRTYRNKMDIHFTTL